MPKEVLKFTSRPFRTYEASQSHKSCWKERSSSAALTVAIVVDCGIVVKALTPLHQMLSPSQQRHPAPWATLPLYSSNFNILRNCCYKLSCANSWTASSSLSPWRHQLKLSASGSSCLCMLFLTVVFGYIYVLSGPRLVWFENSPKEVSWKFRECFSILLRRGPPWRV